MSLLRHRADCEYRAGEKVQSCYGGHSSDFLLSEMDSFVMAEIRWNKVCRDHIILTKFSGTQRADLGD